MQHHCLTSSKDENVHTRNGVCPDFGPLVDEKSEKLGDEDIERPVEVVSVQDLCAVLADLLQRPEAALGDGVVVRVQQLTQSG